MIIPVIVIIMATLGVSTIVSIILVITLIRGLAVSVGCFFGYIPFRFLPINACRRYGPNILVHRGTHIRNGCRQQFLVWFNRRRHYGRSIATHRHPNLFRSQ